ncbi:MAG: hypothetical protein AMXMBFR64_38700 [Myxococcales bacterium]
MTLNWDAVLMGPLLPSERVPGASVRVGRRGPSWPALRVATLLRAESGCNRDARGAVAAVTWLSLGAPRARRPPPASRLPPERGPAEWAIDLRVALRRVPRSGLAAVR